MQHQPTSENSLKENIERIGFALNAAGTGTWHMDPVTDTVDWDEQCRKLFFSSGEGPVPYEQVLHHIHEEDREKVRKGIAAALLNDTDTLFETEFRTCDSGNKEIHWIYFRGRVYFNKEGKALRFSGIAQDITRSARKRAVSGKTSVAYDATGTGRGKSQGSSHAMFKNVTDSAPTGLWLSDEEGGLTYLNNTLVAWTGMPYESLLGAGWADAIIPEDRQQSAEAFLNAVAARTHYDVMFRITKGDGSIIWCRASGDPYYNEDGSYAGYAGFCMDIDELVTARQEQQEAAGLLQSVFDSSEAGISVLKSVRERDGDIIDFRYQLVNRVTEQTNDRTDLAGQLYSAVHSLYREAGMFDDFKSVVETGKSVIRERHYTGEGFDNWYATVAVKLDDGLVFSFRDITPEVRARQDLKANEDRFRSMIEQAPMAIGLLRGREMVIEVGNDKIFEVWGKDPSKTGMQLLDALPEIKGQGFMELLEGVYDSGKPAFGNSILARLERGGVMEDAYFDFAYTPLRNAAGAVSGVMVLATEVTAQVTARKATEESEARFRSLVEEAPVATCLFVGRDMKIEVANDMIIAYWGKDISVIGKSLGAALPELEGQSFLQILDDVFTTGKTYAAKASHAALEIDGRLVEKYFDFTYKPLRNSAGEVYAILNMAVDVTEQVIARQKLEESELFSRSIFYNSPVAKLVLTGEEMVIRTVNENMLDVLGRDESIIGSTFWEAMPELADTPLQDRLRHVFTTGETYFQPEEKITLVRYGRVHTGYYNYIYKALLNTAGERYGIMITATEVTEQVEARRKVEESGQKLSSVVESAPFPIGVYEGREMRIRLANQSIIDVWGKGPDVTGRLYAELLPELGTGDIFRQLDTVYTTGIPFHAKNQRVDLNIDGALQPFYFNYSFTPLFDTQGRVYGVMNTAADITDVVLAKQRVEETEAAMRGAIDLAELGTWEIDLKTRLLDYSERTRGWFGIGMDEIITVERAYEPIREADRPLVKAAILHAITPGTDGIYDVEYAVQAEGRGRILHALGKALFDENGEAYKITGTARDVTSIRQRQLELERQVLERTEELAAINEELQVTNEELAESNERLQHSNEELAQYAYVASHDLQEPLRKIRMFSGMLGARLNLADEDRPLVFKIAQSAERMSQLIRDLLEFSKLLKSESLVRPVDLNEIVGDVVNDFELTIGEKKAALSIGSMPVIQAVGLQMNQLFYNLLGNALKFSRTGAAPVISIASKVISTAEAGVYIQKPLPFAQYHHITISDNGIGFKVKYAEQIFEVFKRLHGRDIYPGSGIGLALCRRIADNHNGCLYAESQEGKGSIFHLILPDRQQDNEASMPAGFHWTDE